MEEGSVQVSEMGGEGIGKPALYHNTALSSEH